MLFGKVLTAATGPTSAMIVGGVKGFFFGGGILLRFKVRTQYVERFFAIFVNGVFIQTVYANESGEVEVMVPGIGDGESISSVYIEDIGAFADLAADVVPYVTAKARQYESYTASNINILWNNLNKYKLTTPNGDSQLSSISITGAKRGVNCTALPLKKTRARLYYTIQTNEDGVHWIRWYDGTRLVAEGSSATDGALTCDEIDGAGLEIPCALTYTGDVALGDAFVEIKWPAYYKIFYSKSSIVYSGPHQAEVEDNGGSEFNYLTPALSNGNWYYNVVAVDDEGDAETGMSDLGPEEIKATPGKPTITNVTQLSPYNFRVTFSGGLGADAHTCYFSNVNEPVNFGDYVDGPAPVAATPTTVDITVNSFTPQDDTSAYTTLEAAFDAAVALANSDFTFSGFDFDTLSNSLSAAIADYADAIKKPLLAKQIALQVMSDACAGNLATLADSDAFDADAPSIYGTFLQQLGLLLKDDPARYTLPDGSTVGSGTQSATGNSLYDIAQPFVKRNFVNIIIRASLLGVEEQNDIPYEIELDDSGNLIGARPAKAGIVSYELTKSGGNRLLTVRAQVVDDNSEPAAYLDLYIVPDGDPIDLATPTQSIELDADIVGYKEGTFDAEIISADTWYQVVVVARTEDDTRSATYDVQKVISNTDTPSAPGGIEAHVVRSKGI